MNEYLLVRRGALFDREQAVVVARADDVEMEFTAAQLGLRTDVPAWRPPAAIGPLANLAILPAAALRPELGDRLDAAAVDLAVDAIAARVDRPSTDATLRVGEEPTLDAAGRALDRAVARAALVEHLVALRSDALELPVVAVPPARARADLEPLAQQSRDVLRRNLRLTDGVREWPLAGSALRPALAVDSDGLSLRVEQAQLAGLVEAVADDVDRPPADARLELRAGRVVVVDEEDGRHVDRPGTLAAMARAVGSGADVLPVVVTADAPAVRAGELRGTAERLQERLDEGIRVEVGGQAHVVGAADAPDLFALAHDRDGVWSLWVDPRPVHELVATLSAVHEQGLEFVADGYSYAVPDGDLTAAIQVRRSAGAWRLSLDPTQAGEMVDRAGDAVDGQAAAPRFGRIGGRLRLLRAEPVGVVAREPAVQAVVDGWRDGVVTLPTTPRPLPTAALPERIDQHDTRQYAGLGQTSLWGSSSCAAAALASALNARGAPVRIDDVVGELGGAISPTYGLLSAPALARAAGAFGVPSRLRTGIGLYDVQRAIAGGDIALVDFVDDAFPEGHWLIVTGVGASEVRVVDSSAARLTRMDRAHLESSWLHRAVFVGRPVWELGAEDG